MYDLISGLIDHIYSTGDSAQQYVFYICGALILMLTASVLDVVYRVFCHFFRGGR